MSNKTSMYNVHVYRTPNVAEVDLEALSPEEAMSKALAMVKSDEVSCDQKSPTKYLAMAFLRDENSD